MGYVEMKWHCDHCDTENWGRDRSCVNCGHVRDENVEFYLPNEKRRVEKIETTNPDWICNFCGALNKDTLDHCEGCGASRDERKGDYFSINKVKAAQKEEKTESSNNQSSHRDYSACRAYEISHRNRFDFSKLGLLGGILGVVLFIFIMIWAFTPKVANIAVNELSWSRSISIEEEKTVREEDWSIPVGGREVSHKEKIHHYDKVIDHYETVTEQKSRQVVDYYEDYVSGYRDLGNGYAEEIISQRPVYKTEYYTETRQEPRYRDEPNYQTWYVYDIERWLKCRSVDTSGKDKKPYWGTVELAEKEREGAKTEKYYVTGINKKNDEQVTYTVPYDLWNKIDVDTVINVKVSFGNIVELIE